MTEFVYIVSVAFFLSCSASCTSDMWWSLEASVELEGALQGFHLFYTGYIDTILISYWSQLFSF